MKLQELIREIHWLEWQLRVFEDKYGVLSRDFYQAMESGELSAFDDGEEPYFHVLSRVARSLQDMAEA